MITEYIAKRLQEASTIRNIIMLFGGTWAQTHPEEISHIVPLVMTLVGLIGTVLPDKFFINKLDSLFNKKST